MGRELPRVQQWWPEGCHDCVPLPQLPRRRGEGGLEERIHGRRVEPGATPPPPLPLAPPMP
eukprot:11234559-Prorocentrum_lima.AAC.1